MIHVLATTVAEVLDGTRGIGGAAALVSPGDLAAARSRRGLHGDRTLAGRAALRLLLTHVQGGAPAAAGSLLVDRTCEECGGAHGRPRAPGMSLSSSTSQDRVLVAVAAEEWRIGVDVQALPRAVWPGFDAAVLHPLERRTGPTDVHARIVLWARKEALLKAAGVGLRVDPAHLRLHSPRPSDHPWTGVAADAPDEVRGLRVRTLPGSVPQAIAASGPSPLRRVDLEAVLPPG